MEPAAVRGLPRAGIRRGAPRVRVGASPAVRRGRPAHGRDRAAGESLQADDDDARASHRARRPRPQEARPARRPGVSHLADRAWALVHAGRRGSPRGAQPAGALDDSRRRSGHGSTRTERSDGAMKSRTVTTVLNAPQREVFAYLADVRNLPDWATEFARELKVVDGKHKVVNGLGEFFIQIDADEETGVIDMLSGPTEDELAVFPTRVVPMGERRSAFI